MRSLESILNGSHGRITELEALVNAQRRHVFISHHFADDRAVDALTALMKRGGVDVRNSSIRLKDANKQRLEKGEVSDLALRRALRMKISWAQTTVVLIGKETHDREWVNYEIEEAHRQGKAIIGVYEQGNQDAKIPEALDSFATTIVAWNTDAILSAVEGTLDAFQAADGSERSPSNQIQNRTC
ncbi:TIR domain-containing protein [Stenotrophomonas sp. TWI1183]|uniref:TIR domain-containing protein n=1 Tax=Stenotrophomonas sp. TWI1183 TaxID=3136799 RepID=UPI0032090D5C